MLKTFNHPEFPGRVFTVERGEARDFPEVKWLFDTYSSGVYGFVPDSRIRRSLLEGAVHLVKVDGDVVAAAIGHPGRTLWNIMAVPEYRYLHLGTLLVQATDPQVIRVKCRPHPGMSEKDLGKFSDPTPFYERLGFVEVGWDRPRNYYKGKDQTTGRGKFIREGAFRSVKIMRRLKPGEKAPDEDLSPGPRATVTPETSPGPRVRTED